MSTKENILRYLQARKEKTGYRQLSVQNGIDFSSNDYLGLSRSALLQQQIKKAYEQYKYEKSGATGSRLLNGNSILYEKTEQMLAMHHHAPAALMFNSGFDANVGLIATVARNDDIIFYDELVHASIHQGMKLSGATLVAYKHNDYEDLEIKIIANSNVKNRFLITESIFSMEGDKADLTILAKLSNQYSLNFIVDEAHATGLFGSKGSGLCNEAGVENYCFARVYTFGKAMGCHGAVVVGEQWLKEYLINFSKNFIYTTALDTHSLLSVEHSYFFIQSISNQCNKLFLLINYFNKVKVSLKHRYIITGTGPIFGVILKGNEQCRLMAVYLQKMGLDIRPILSPTVPEGTERLRVVLHSYNTNEQIDLLFSLLIDYK